MAEGILSDAVGRILELLGSSTFQEIQLAYGVKDEIRKLRDTVETINGVLLDAEEQFNQKKNHAVTIWLRRLKDAVYDADDLLDDFYTQCKLKEMVSGNKMAKEVRIFFSKSNQLGCDLKMGHKIKTIRERLNDIKNDEQFLLFKHDNGKGVSYYNREREETHSFECEENVIGRDDDKKAILQLLLDPNDRAEKNVSVISIVGIGGVGKTTLAQSIYNSEDVKKHFQLRMWVCVSENFTLKIIVEKILKSATGKGTEKFEMDQLQERLREQIDGKKYLLVLDDKWNENLDKWLKLETLLKKGAKGTKILVTTRSERVATIMSRPPLIYGLRGLTEGKSWALFAKIAFEEGKEPRDHSRLVAIGKDIVAKCVGVPLAIRTIGRLLCCNNREEDWLSFRDNELSEITQEDGDILPILKLSYDHLSLQLKQCFAYCALFPKDYEFEKENLIRLWMAQGFLHTSKKNQYLEDVGNEYFMNLLSGSFLLNLKETEYPWGRVMTCKMHDLMHDLASIIGSECTVVTSYADNVDERSRHISFDTNLNSLEISTSMLRLNKLRTFLSLCYTELHEFHFNKILSSFRYLRTLNLSHLEIQEVPISISILKHLRYLNLSWNENIKELPNSLSKLINLQTLDLSGCLNLEKLPGDMSKMMSLQYLMIDGCYSLTSMPHGLGQLTGLRTISLFVVGKRDINELKELNGLNKLRGRLAIRVLGGMENVNLAEANLEGKQYLESIRLEGDIIYGGATMVEGLKPHPYLKELSICCLGSVMFSGCMSSFTNLTKIEISDSSNFQYITPLDQLPSLLSLTLQDLESLEYISESGKVSNSSSSTSTPPPTFFPSLKKLTIENCDKLKGWWKINDDEDDQVTTTEKAELLSFPCLSELNIWYCPMLICMPLYPTLEKLYLCRTGTKALQQTMMMKMKMNTRADVAAPSTSYSAFALSNLKFLSLRFMNELECLPELLQRVTSLVEMDISDSPRLLFQLPQCVRYLSSLEQLRIGGYYQLDLLDDDDDDNGEKWQGLRNLRHLVFEQIEKMEGLPKWIHRITSLQLEKLEVVNCPHLSERCGNKMAVDWPKVAHIPNILVDDQWIQMEGCYQLVGTSQHLNISRNRKKDSRANKIQRDTTIHTCIKYKGYRSHQLFPYS